LATTVPLKKTEEFVVFLESVRPRKSEVVTFGNRVRKKIP